MNLKGLLGLQPGGDHEPPPEILFQDGKEQVTREQFIEAIQEGLENLFLYCESYKQGNPIKVVATYEINKDGFDPGVMVRNYGDKVIYRVTPEVDERGNTYPRLIFQSKCGEGVIIQEIVRGHFNGLEYELDFFDMANLRKAITKVQYIPKGVEIVDIANFPMQEGETAKFIFKYSLDDGGLVESSLYQRNITKVEIVSTGTTDKVTSKKEAITDGALSPGLQGVPQPI